MTGPFDRHYLEGSQKSPHIPEETRQRVLKRVKELEYQPNILARGLVTGRSYLIGPVVPDLLHPFIAELAKAFSAAIGIHGYCTIITSSEEDPELEAREIQQLMGRGLDALVVASSGSSHFSAWTARDCLMF